MITGGCGAMGSVIINYLTRKYKHTRFVNLDLLTYCGHEENICTPLDNYVLYKGDICDKDLVTHILNTEQPTVLIHLAAETHVDNSFYDSMKFSATNILGTHTLLECARQYGKLNIFLHMSTDEVYGSVDTGISLKENATFAPSNPYAATKVGAEMLCFSYKHSFGLPICITRCNNVISPYQDNEKLIPKCISCIKDGVKIPIHGHGKSLRTFIDARDIAFAFETIIENISTEKLRNHWVFNIGTSEKYEYSVLEIVQKIVGILKPGDDISSWVEFVQDRPFQDFRYSVDSGVLRSVGWHEKHSFDDSLMDVINHKYFGV
jgi:dTDP-glucose 4,6-dehydratase